ncbi:MAG: hypothetical protein ACOYJS_02530 [Acutalibacteraceae bacterium]
MATAAVNRKIVIKKGTLAAPVNKFIKKNTVMCIAFCAALLTCFIIPIDHEYLNYFDVKTLTCLFCSGGCLRP